MSKKMALDSLFAIADPAFSSEFVRAFLTGNCRKMCSDPEFPNFKIRSAGERIVFRL